MKTICTVPPVGPDRWMLHWALLCNCGPDGAFFGAGLIGEIRAAGGDA
ncbi:MAG TPA: hypothetical protein VFO07_19690 [Roseiflexaceae bacterium]|nr:hypothetical protein [Roseiflexaceae bacterium]